MVVLAWLTIVLTVILPWRFLHLEPQSAELRRLSTQGHPPCSCSWPDPSVLATVLPKGVEWGQARPSVPKAIAALALGISVMSVGYAIRNPWTHPWILDAAPSI